MSTMATVMFWMALIWMPSLVLLAYLLLRLADVGPTKS